MTISSLVIDFGTSRTKVGWRDASGNIHCLKWGDLPYLPSVFHLPPDCTDILLGEEALEAMEDDPIGGIENFKRQILESGEMELTYPDRQESSVCQQRCPVFFTQNIVSLRDEIAMGLKGNFEL